MNSENKLNIKRLISDFTTLKEKRVVDSQIDTGFVQMMKIATELKRTGKYDEALAIYIECIDKHGTIIPSDVVDSLVKVLYSTNDYGAALYLAFLCTVATMSDSTAEQRNTRLMNKIAMDCAYLAKGISNAADGRPDLIMKRTISVSGNAYYCFTLSPEGIIEKANEIIDGKEEFGFPKGAIELFLELPIVQSFFEEEYTYAPFL